MSTRRRGNSEGSIYPVPGGWRGYAWVTGPDGIRRRKYVKATRFEDAQRAWLRLRTQADRGPVASSLPKLSDYLIGWLTDVVKPNLAPKTYEKYDMFARLHIIPYLGTRRLDKLTPRDIRHWLNQLRQTCQCCAQGKDARRPEDQRRCCAAGNCCGQVISARTLKDARDTLRAALGHALAEDELISRNAAAMVRLPVPRSRRVRAWSVAEVCQFLESARVYGDPLYAAYVLMLILGLRRGEALGLLWANVDLETAELGIAWQLQRTGGQLHHRETKTAHSDAALPLPPICIAALRDQADAQAAWQTAAGQAWHDSGLVITTTYGTPYEPRNFNRHYAARCTAAQVRYVSPHGTRRTCASLLAALDVHPRVAMRILRHSKIAVTMEIYTEVPDDITREALRRLGEQFDGSA